MKKAVLGTSALHAVQWSKLNLYVILLNSHRPESVQTAVMVEEIGHYHTCVGNALDQDNVVAVKVEMAGQQIAYKATVPIQSLKAALASGICSLWEPAERFGLPDKFIREDYEYYKRKGSLDDIKIACN